MSPLTEKLSEELQDRGPNLQAVGYCCAEPCSRLRDSVEKMGREEGRIVCEEVCPGVQ